MYDIVHALDVARRVNVLVPSDDLWLIALLHDVVEDTELEEYDLIEAGVPPTIVGAVSCLTHRPGEPYADYIERVRKHPLARLVKIADIESNLARMDEAHECNRSKYLIALDDLMHAVERRETP